MMGIKNLFAVSNAPTITGEVEDLTAVSESVKESSSEDTVAKDFGPTFKALVGSNDDGSLFIEFGDEGEEEIGLGARNGKVSELINNKQLAFFEPSQTVLRLNGDFLSFEDMNEVIHRSKGNLTALSNCLIANSQGNMSLTGTWRANEDEVIKGIEPFEFSEDFKLFCGHAFLEICIEVVESLKCWESSISEPYSSGPVFTRFSFSAKKVENEFFAREVWNCKLIVRQDAKSELLGQRNDLGIHSLTSFQQNIIDAQRPNFGTDSAIFKGEVDGYGN